MPYDLQADFLGVAFAVGVRRAFDGAQIPLSLDNTDFQLFLVEWAAGLPVFESDGVTPFPDTPANRALLGLP